MQNRKTILIINNDLEFGGIQKSLIQFVRHLDQQGEAHIDLILWQKGGPLEKMLPRNVRPIYQEYPPVLSDICKASSLLQWIRMLSNFLRNQYFTRIRKKPWMYYSKALKPYDFAISFTHTGLARFFTIDMVLAHQKFLWYHHGVYLNNSEAKDLDMKYYEQYDKIITVSESNKMMLSGIFPELQHQMVVVPNIIDSDEITTLSQEPLRDMSLSPKTYQFVTVSRFSPEKGLDLALNIAAALKMKGLLFKWYFIGDGELFSEIKDLAANKDVEEECVFLGSRENPYPYIKAADLYIQSSYVEAHPLTINEALVLQKVVVATDLPSIREVLQNGKLGILCPANSVYFSDSIINLLADGERLISFQKMMDRYHNSNEAAWNAIHQIFNNQSLS